MAGIYIQRHALLLEGIEHFQVDMTFKQVHEGTTGTQTFVPSESLSTLF